MYKKLKPHYMLILISTIKTAAVLSLFYAAAVFLSPNRYYSALNLLKMFIPAIVLAYVYLFFFWQSIEIELSKKELIFTMKFGRKNHIEILCSDIDNVSIKQGWLEKIFGVSRVCLTLKNSEKTYGSDTMVLEHYLVFKNETANEFAKFIC
ncbi:MAG: PH domain-containing protein [Firmicutes bacterium]|nr:PH domain-containing protein [Bacillota bacterium]